MHFKHNLFFLKVWKMTRSTLLFFWRVPLTSFGFVKSMMKKDNKWLDNWMKLADLPSVARVASMSTVLRSAMATTPPAPTSPRLSSPATLTSAWPGGRNTGGSNIALCRCHWRYTNRYRIYSKSHSKLQEYRLLWTDAMLGSYCRDVPLTTALATGRRGSTHLFI